MNGKHTPPPWAVEDYGDMGVAVVAADVTFDVICWPHPDNACLIAAAPDLLAAAKLARAQLLAAGFDGFGSGLDAAIAKAEGQS